MGSRATRLLLAGLLLETTTAKPIWRLADGRTNDESCNAVAEKAMHAGIALMIFAQWRKDEESHLAYYRAREPGRPTQFIAIGDGRSAELGACDWYFVSCRCHLRCSAHLCSKCSPFSCGIAPVLPILTNTLLFPRLLH